MALTTIPVPVVASLSYNREVFLTSGSFTLPATAQGKFDAVLVSGGGGGGRHTANPRRAMGGAGNFAYFHDIFCTNGTTLTITVGAGGAGATSNGSGNPGTASTITGLAGNGASTSISSGAANGGNIGNYGLAGIISPNVGFRTISGGYGQAQYASKNMTQGFGAGLVAFGSGTSTSNVRTNKHIFGTATNQTKKTAGSGPEFIINSGGSGGPIPLLGSMLHATVGTNGTAGTSAGGTSQPDTFFAGSGGGTYYSYAGSDGFGGGGGSGGGSNISGTFGGNGGNASVNSGGGGGAAGTNNPTPSNAGTAGSGGSGFVIIGYWG